MSGTRPLSGRAVVVTTTPTPLLTVRDRDVAAVFNNGATAVYVGGADVTVATGFPVAPGTSLAVDTRSSGLYGIVALGTEEVRVLEA